MNKDFIMNLDLGQKIKIGEDRFMEIEKMTEGFTIRYESGWRTNWATSGGNMIKIWKTLNGIRRAIWQELNEWHKDLIELSSPNPTKTTEEKE